MIGEFKTGRVVVKEVEITEREKTKIEYQLILDGHVLGQSKSQCDALFHGYAVEKSLMRGIRATLEAKE
jgi:hypothetical protein